MGQHMRGDAGVPDGIMNSTACTYKEPDIVEDIKIRRLEWAVHIMMEEERIPKKVLNGNFLVFPLVL
jgi:hypothetical protein